MSAAIKTADPAPAERGGVDGGLRVLAVYERSRNGEHTLREAAEMATGGARLTVVTLAPQAPPAAVLRVRLGRLQLRNAR